MARYDIDYLKSIAAGRWPDLLGIDVEFLDRSREHPCPKCGGNTRFRALKDFEQTGAVYCSHCFSRGNGDGIAAYAWFHDCTIGKAISDLAEALGVQPEVGSSSRSGSSAAKRKPGKGASVAPRAQQAASGGQDGKPPKRPAEEQFRWSTWSDQIAAIFATRKGGIQAPSLVAVGARLGNHFGVPVVALPLRDESGGTIGYVAANAIGGRITINYPSGESETTSWKNVIDAGRKGICATANLFVEAERAKLTRIFKTEGPSDLLAIIPFLQPGEGAFCNPAGANENPINFPWLAKWLAGKSVAVIHDRDAAGESGAMGDAERGRLGWATWAAKHAAEVRKVDLPYPMAESKGADFRQWVIDGGGVDEFITLVGSALKVDAPDDIPTEISNYILNYEIDKDGTERRVKTPIPINLIIDQVRSEFGGWPKCVGGQLFHHARNTTRYFSTPAALFGWMQEKRVVRWGRGEDLCTKEEFFSVMSEKGERYLELQAFPHFPPIPNMYYTCPTDVKPGDMAALNGFLDFFTPDNPLDRQLMLACVATLFWGGPPGQRPGWLISSPLRQGAGKSSFSEKVADLAGGIFDFNIKADPDKDKTRLLSKDGAGKRCARYDNIKAVRFSLSTLESLITSANISGHRMYHGEGARSNYLTWFVTMNDPELSRDLAQRCVSVSLGAPRRTGDWTLDINNYIEKNRQAIICDVAAFFIRPIKMVRKVNRWGSWVKDIICRLDSPQEVFDLIEERESKNDSDAIGAEELNEYVHDKMKKLGYYHPAVVHIPNHLMANWVNNCIGNNMRAAASLKLVRQFHGSGLLLEIEPNPCRTNGRGWIYRSGGFGDSQTLYDIEQRIFERNKKFENSGRKTSQENNFNDGENEFPGEEIPF